MTSLPSLSVLNLPEPVMNPVAQTQKQTAPHTHSHLTYTHLPVPVGGSGGNGLSQYSFDTKPASVPGHNMTKVVHNMTKVTPNVGNVTHNVGNATHNVGNVAHNTGQVVSNPSHITNTVNLYQIPYSAPTPPSMNPPTPTPSELPASPATQLDSPATSPPMVTLSQHQHPQQTYPTSVPHAPTTMLTPLYTPEASRRNSTEKEYFGVLSQNMPQNMPQNLHLHQQHIQQQLQQQQMHQQQQQQQYYPHGYRQASLSPPQHYHWDNQPQMVGLAPSHELKQKMHKRQVRKRTKTGCMTCRKRRIKCDGAKPSCFNCAKSKRDCMGYALVPM